MKLCFSTLGCPEWSLEQIAQNAKAYGFDGVELRIDGNRHVDPSFSVLRRKEINNLFRDSGINIACLSGYTQFCGDDAGVVTLNGEILLKNAALAADLGAPYVRTFLGADGALTACGEAALRYYSEKAYDMNVTIIIEIHDALKTGKQARELLSKIDSRGLKILWDIHQSVNCGEVPEETLSSLGDDIRHVHMKDANIFDKICNIGEGVLPAAKVARLLEESGYNGYLSYEWEKMWIPQLEAPELAFPKYISFMRGL